MTILNEDVGDFQLIGRFEIGVPYDVSIKEF